MLNTPDMPPIILFAHGAGAPSGHPWIRAWSDRLSACGKVITFDYPYMQQGRRTPDRQPQLIQAHAQAAKQALQDSSGAPLVLMGKSMGSRIGCHLAAEIADAGEVSIKALVCFGYPLRSASSGKSRAEILRELRAPIMFIQGTRDPLCPLPELETLLPTLQAPNHLMVVDGADHSLVVAKRALASRKETQHDVDERILQGIKTFLTMHG